MDIHIEIESGGKHLKLCVTDGTHLHELDEFTGDNDEFKIVDTGILKLFADVSDVEGINSVHSLANQVKTNPLQTWAVSNWMRKNMHMLREEQKRRLAPDHVVEFTNSYSHHPHQSLAKLAYNQFSAVRRGTLLMKKAIEKCLDWEQLARIGLENGCYAVLECKDGVLSEPVPDEVLAYFKAWRESAYFKTYVGTTSPMAGDTFVLAWNSPKAPDFYI